MRLIDANRLEGAMYHNAFEITTDLQKWDSGCWIRYKMFENVIDEQPTVNAIPIKFIEKQIEQTTDINNRDELDILYAGNLSYLIKLWEKEHGKD